MDNMRFVVSKNSFFLPISAIKSVFRGKFLEQLKTLFIHNQLRLPEELNSISQKQKLLNRLYAMDWIIYCKKPFKDASNVIRYLGRYTHRVAISDSRIISYDPDNGTVRFKWKDYKDHNMTKIMELPDAEFVRRFLLHVLPPGFMKIRHYGFLSNKGRDHRLAVCRKLLLAIRPHSLPVFLAKQFPKPRHCCPNCGSCSFAIVFSSPRHQPVLFPTGSGP